MDFSLKDSQGFDFICTVKKEKKAKKVKAVTVMMSSPRLAEGNLCNTMNQLM